MTDSQKKLYDAVLEKDGLLPRIDDATENLACLIICINKIQRDVANHEALLEKITDVEMTLNFLKCAFDISNTTDNRRLKKEHNMKKGLNT